MKCIVEDCDREAKKRNMCNKHYERWRKYGTTILKRAPPGEPLRYLHEEVLTYKGEDCLYWPYAHSSHGYGEIRIDGVVCHVHTVVCEIVHGHRPSSRHVVSHKCGKGHLGCCNHKHLKWQTYEEDSADKVTHGTSNRGPQHVMSKLTENDIREILSLKGKLSQREIAEKFGVHQVTISKIMLRKRWSWLK